MLQLSNKLSNITVMSLRTGGKIAIANEPIINPHNLKLEGWYCTDYFNKQELILLAKDVRDFVPQGIAVNDYEVLSEPEDLVRLQEILEIRFKLIGLQAVTNHKRRLGKVSDYALDDLTMLVQKLYISRPVYRSLSDGQLSVDRSQIVEITDRRVVVREADIKVHSQAVSPAPVTT